MPRSFFWVVNALLDAARETLDRRRLEPPYLAVETPRTCDRMPVRFVFAPHDYELLGFLRGGDCIQTKKLVVLELYLDDVQSRPTGHAAITPLSDPLKGESVNVSAYGVLYGVLMITE